jgi:DNA helicase-2/ATP-dependent DNA helicase PcrA
MRSRLRSLGTPTVQARTFHSAALRQLRFFWPRISDGPFPELLPQKATLVGHAMQAVGIAPERETIRDVAAEIEHAAVSLLGVEDYVERAGARPLPDGIDLDAMAQIMQRYGELKTERRVLDFEDVLLVLVGALGTHEDIAAQVHSQYRSFVVDEFQDVSPLQHDLLMRWLGRREDLCVVGDPAQTIYTFAGATDRFLRRMSVDFPSSQEVRLVRNYRSAEPVIGIANAVLRRTGRTPIQLIGTQRSGPPPAFTEYADDAAEAEAIAARIAGEIESGRRPADIAILFRTNSQSRAFEEALGARGVSYVLRGGERFFARREVKEALAVMRASSHREGSDPLDVQVKDILSSIGWSPTAPQAQGAVRERWESLSALVGLAQDSQAESQLPVPLAAFIADLDDRAEHQFAPTIDGVTLASVHAAKGLEWESVHLAGVSEGLLPIGYAETAEAIDEERRLFYVAVTRARTALSLGGSPGQARGPGPHRGRRGSRALPGVLVPAPDTGGPEPGTLRAVPGGRGRGGPRSAHPLARRQVDAAEHAGLPGPQHAHHAGDRGAGAGFARRPWPGERHGPYQTGAVRTRAAGTDPGSPLGLSGIRQSQSGWKRAGDCERSPVRALMRSSGPNSASPVAHARRARAVSVAAESSSRGSTSACGDRADSCRQPVNHPSSSSRVCSTAHVRHGVTPGRTGVRSACWSPIRTERWAASSANRREASPTFAVQRSTRTVVDWTAPCARAASTSATGRGVKPTAVSASATTVASVPSTKTGRSPTARAASTGPRPWRAANGSTWSRTTGPPAAASGGASTPASVSRSSRESARVRLTPRRCATSR